MIKRSAYLIFLVFLLSACTLPVSSPTETPVSSDDAIATEVSKLLTVIPPTAQSNLPYPVATGESPTQPVTVILPTETASPTVTPLPTETSLPSATPTPLPTFTPPTDDPRNHLSASPTYQDTMDSDRAWATDTDKYTRLSISNGIMTLEAIGEVDGWRLTWPETQDFYLEMNVQTQTCSGSDHYGIIFRVPDKTSADRGYLYGYTCDGKYSLREWDGKKMTNLIPWTTNSAIQAGSNSSNRMGLLADGNRIGLYANGVFLGDTQDDSYPEKGGLGLFIGEDETNGFTIQVNDFSYWDDPNF